MASVNIGMMEGAYFVGRQEILSWINSTVGGDYTKIEQTANGVCQCQLFSLLYPGKVPLHRLVVKPRTEYDWGRNMKLLQEAFVRVGLDKQLDIPKLLRGKYQDNLEFLQWFKAFYDRSGGPSAAQVEEMRAAGTLHANATIPKSSIAAKPAAVAPAKPLSASSSASAPTSATSAPTTSAQSNSAVASVPAVTASSVDASTATATTTTTPTSTTTTTTAGATRPGLPARPNALSALPAVSSAPAVRNHSPRVLSENTAPNRASSRTATGTNNNSSTTNTTTTNASLVVEMKALKQRESELQSKAEQMQSERDFYFSKLRAIEILCQNLLGEEGDGVGANPAVIAKYNTAQAFASDTLKILYATDTNNN